MKYFLTLLLTLLCMTNALADSPLTDYVLGPGDEIRVAVFQNPDLTTETRVSETGSISLPLVGTVPVGGETLINAENKIAKVLRDGGFIVKPQVTVQLLQIRGNQVAVLGQFNRPGRYPLETANVHLSDMLALAGGIAPTGGDVVVVGGVREGKRFKREIDVTSMFLKGDTAQDISLSAGDTLFVDRASMFYIYGEVQRPGNFRLERDMSVMQALATAGGITLRGTLRGLEVHRRDANGKVQIVRAKMEDLLQPNDIVLIQESLF
jgi:polysaccharide export outer membrane protein